MRTFQPHPPQVADRRGVEVPAERLLHGAGAQPGGGGDLGEADRLGGVVLDVRHGAPHCAGVGAARPVRGGAHGRVREGLEHGGGQQPHRLAVDQRAGVGELVAAEVVGDVADQVLPVPGLLGRDGSAQPEAHPGARVAGGLGGHPLDDVEVQLDQPGLEVLPVDAHRGVRVDEEQLTPARADVVVVARPQPQPSARHLPHEQEAEGVGVDLAVHRVFVTGDEEVAAVGDVVAEPEVVAAAGEPHRVLDVGRLQVAVGLVGISRVDADPRGRLDRHDSNLLVTLGSSPLTLRRPNAPLSGKRRTVIPYTRTVAAGVVRWSRSGYKSGVCTGNGRTPAPSGATLDLPKPQSADVSHRDPAARQRLYGGPPPR